MLIWKRGFRQVFLCGVAALLSFELTAQNPEALSRFFEGKSVTVKLDMPGSQKGVDIYPHRPQPLDTKSYADRLKAFGTSLRNGDSVVITKVKVKNDSLEFQLGGGGYGTAGDNTDGAVHFTPVEKSNHEKELEDQLSKETDEDRRRSLSRELDDLRRDRERQDRRNQARAEEDADARKQQIAMNRVGGGSRFNIHLDKQTAGGALTPQVIMDALAQYVVFPPETFGPNGSGPASGPMVHADPGGPPPPQPAADPTKSLKKGLTRAQVEALFGPPTETHESNQGGLAMTSCTYQSASQTVKGDFVNGVLVQYTISSR
jgi:hypothetical protein